MRRIPITMTRLFVLCFVVFSVVSAQQTVSPTTDAATTAARIDEYINAHVRQNNFSGSVLVARDGRAILNRGYDLADRERNVLNTPQTRFRIGSLTKQFTAMGIMILQTRGRLSVRDSVCRYVADCPVAWQPVTLHQLLTHTAGIPNYTDFPEYQSSLTTSRTVAQLINFFKNRSLDFAPGTRFSYSNSGYILLGYIIERASGQIYAEFLRQNIFAPLSMNDTGYATNERGLTNRAVGYTRAGQHITIAAPIDMTIPFAAGGLYSTVEDLLKWDQALYTERLVPRPVLDEIFSTTNTLSVGALGGNYGYGWMTITERGRRAQLHGGAINGFQSFIARFPDTRSTLVILSNNEMTDDEAIARDLTRLLFGENVQMPRERRAIQISPEILNRYVGRYELTPNFLITITNEAGKLMLQATAQPKFELFAESETRFFLREVDAQITFERDASNRTTGLILHQNGQNMPGRRLAEGEANRETYVTSTPAVRVEARILDSYVGEYELAPNVTVSVVREGERMWTQITGQPRFEMRAISETRFRLIGVEAEVAFERGQDNRVSTLVIHQSGQTVRAAKIR